MTRFGDFMSAVIEPALETRTRVGRGVKLTGSLSPTGLVFCVLPGLPTPGHGQIFELVTQLREKAGPRQVDFARVAVQENGGGLLGIEDVTAAVTVLSR